MPSYQPLASSYASDEDIAVRAGGDFAVLVPKEQKLAEGSDGTIAGWALTSAAVDFGAQGVTPGTVVGVSFATPAQGQQAARAPQPGIKGELFAVDSVAAKTINLRRIGSATGIGQPPTPGAAAFVIRTFGPQIDAASYDEINHRYGIEPTNPGRTAADVFDLRQVNRATVWAVLKEAYMDEARDAGEGADDFMAKSRSFEQKFNDVIDRLNLKWRGTSGWGSTLSDPTTSVFGMRISR